MRDVGQQSVARGLCVLRTVIARPIQHFDRTVTQAIAKSLACASWLYVEFRTGSRKRERAVATVASGIGDDADPRCLAHGARSCQARNGLTHVAFESREEQVQRSPSRGLGCEARLGVGKRSQRAITEQRNHRDDRHRDQHLEQRESRPLGVEGHHRRDDWAT